MTDWHEPIIQAAFIFLVSYAIVTDLRQLRVPNLVPLGIAGLFFVHGLSAHEGVAFIPHLLTGAAVLLITFSLFIFGACGGGDAKLLSALALWMGPAHIGVYILLTALLGGLTAVGLLGLKKLLVLNPALEQHAAIAKPLAWARAGKMPYALPLGLAALMLGPYLF